MPGKSRRSASDAYDQAGSRNDAVIGAQHGCASHAAPGHCQSKFVYFAKTSEPDFVAIDFPAFFRVDLSGSMAAPSI